jgi:hypothetical protein
MNKPAAFNTNIVRNLDAFEKALEEQRALLATLRDGRGARR